MKKILYTNFTDSNSIIEDMLKRKDIKKAVTRNNLYKFWSKIAGKKLSAHSKPYSMMHDGTMVIACENNIVMQELILQKFQLLKKFEPYVKSLKMTVKDLKFDAKKWELIK